jgi:ribosomal protein L11 methyltransferase
MKYIELSFSFSQNTDFADIVVAKLNEIEFESYVETQDGVDAYIQESLFNQEKLNEVIEDLQSLFQFEYTIKEIKQENWNQQWEENFNPVEINKDCFIRAHFHDKIDCKYEIIITPKMSFGTGHHETTFLMMNEMFHIDFNNKKVLDMGCGTGILAILSKMLGSSITQAIDIDEWSYENSVENATLNNTEDINFSLGDVTAIKGAFDVVLANINRNIILEDISKYIDSLNENSDLLLSGFLSEDVIIIRDKVESLGLSFVSHKNKNKWNLLHFTN